MCCHFGSDAPGNAPLRFLPPSVLPKRGAGGFRRPLLPTANATSMSTCSTHDLLLHSDVPLLLAPGALAAARRLLHVVAARSGRPHAATSSSDSSSMRMMDYHCDSACLMLTAL